MATKSIVICTVNTIRLDSRVIHLDIGPRRPTNNFQDYVSV
jgi:hypothetical protein